MKQLTKEQQEQAVELIEKSIIDSGDYSKYIESAKAFLQSLKPKIYVCQNISGTFYYFSKSVLNEDYVCSINDAHRFDSIEDARIFIDEENNINYPLYILIG